jgi:hypothetical protein
MRQALIWAPCLKLALKGGRKFGQAEHKVLVQNLLTRHVLEVDGEISVGEGKTAKKIKVDLEMLTEALNEVCNISAFQQFLESEGVIDRVKRGKAAKVDHNLKALLA